MRHIDARHNSFILFILKVSCKRQRENSIFATDEVTSTLKELKRQLHAFEKPKHGRFGVSLISKSRNIYGIVFASYARKKEEADRGSRFFKDILDKARGDFRYHDLSMPYFRPVFDNVKVDILDSTFLVTLKSGLWKRV